MSSNILTQESTLVDLFAASRLHDVNPGVMLRMIDHTPAWAATYDVEADEAGRKVVTFSREVETVEIRQAFYLDTWEPAGEESDPVVAFYSYQDARENGYPQPQVSDVMRAIEILQDLGAWPTGAEA